jgi:hypothetical protein
MDIALKMSAQFFYFFIFKFIYDAHVYAYITNKCIALLLLLESQQKLFKTITIY